MANMKPKLVSVKVKDGNLQKALKMFKRKVEESNHLNEFRERTHFVKPSILKRIQKQEAIFKQKKRLGCGE